MRRILFAILIFSPGFVWAQTSPYSDYTLAIIARTYGELAAHRTKQIARYEKLNGDLGWANRYVVKIDPETGANDHTLYHEAFHVLQFMAGCFANRQGMYSWDLTVVWWAVHEDLRLDVEQEAEIGAELCLAYRDYLQQKPPTWTISQLDLMFSYVETYIPGYKRPENWRLGGLQNDP